MVARQTPAAGLFADEEDPVARARIRLPRTVRACLFDLDGVVTDTASLHARAWQQMFDGFLRTRPEPFVPFHAPHDYAAYLDGRERYDGVRSFLRARGIALPEGRGDDPPTVDTVHGLGNRKNALVLELIRRSGGTAFPDALRFLESVRAAGLATAVVSSSANCAAVLESEHLADAFDARIDAQAASVRGLRGKPAPDMFLAAATALDVSPAEAAVFEDALVGVAAGHAGGFVPVVGIARSVAAADLRAHGADVVVHDLDELLERA